VSRLISSEQSHGLGEWPLCTRAQGAPPATHLQLRFGPGQTLLSFVVLVLRAGFRPKTWSSLDFPAAEFGLLWLIPSWTAYQFRSRCRSWFGVLFAGYILPLRFLLSTVGDDFPVLLFARQVWSFRFSAAGSLRSARHSRLLLAFLLRELASPHSFPGR
jgi:hypothetical protein